MMTLEFKALKLKISITIMKHLFLVITMTWARTQARIQMIQCHDF